MDAGHPLASDTEKILFGMTVDSCQNQSMNHPTQYICQKNIFTKGRPPKEKTSELKAKGWQKLHEGLSFFGKKLTIMWYIYCILY